MADGPLRIHDWFCGAGGSTQGAAAVPGVEPTHAANHWKMAIESHAANFPQVDHWRGDIRDIDVARLPYAELFWASPECTNWTQAKGVEQTYREQDALPGMGPVTSEEADRSRALMEEVPQYLRAMALRGRPVLAGVVENVTDIREWVDWRRWRAEIEAVGYRTRLIALNSMHAESRLTPRAPQSRDRLYLAYWHVRLGRDPDWDKWLRPTAFCPSCDEWVQAVQVWKRPDRDMGRYRQQYAYRCPRVSCRNRIVEPTFLPAAAAIDWSVRGERIGDRPRPLADKTLRRIEAGIRKLARPVTVEAAISGVVVAPLLVPVEGRDGKAASSMGSPLRTQSTRNETAVAAAPFLVRHYTPRGQLAQMSTSAADPAPTLTASTVPSLVVPPMLVPAGGTWNEDPAPLGAPMRTRTVRESEAVLVAPFIAELRGGGSTARPVGEPLATVTASGNHHGLVVPAMLMRNNGSRGDGGEHCTPVDDVMRTLTTTGHQSLVQWGWDEWAALYAYDAGAFADLTRPLPTQTTVQGDALVSGIGLPAVEDCLFRMLEPHEIGAGMAFRADYVVLGNRRERVRQYGNAVTPPVAEVLVSALVECITGEDLERAA